MYQHTSEFSLNFDVFHTRTTEIAPSSLCCTSTKPHFNNSIAYILWNYFKYELSLIKFLLLYVVTPNINNSTKWIVVRHQNKIICLLTYAMEQSPSWEANRFSASQEIPRILWNPKVHYRIHKCPSPFPILSQINPVHVPTTDFLNIHLNIILPSTPGSSKGPISLRFSH